jgi:glutaredoxin
MLGENATKQELLAAVPGARSVPQIFFNEVYVGGLPELRNALR